LGSCNFGSKVLRLRVKRCPLSDPMVVFAFLTIVFTPCLIGFVSWASESEDLELCVGQGRALRRMGPVPAPLQAMASEAEIAPDFAVRRFPKGIGQRRIVVRDSEAGVKLTISQVREAAIELAKLGGFVVAHELALIAAALVAAGKSVAAAAREALEAARNAYVRMAWSGALSQEHAAQEAWDVGPPKHAAVSVLGPARIASRAA